MTRFITIILLLLVFFFGGMSYGSFERDRQTTLSEPAVVEEIEVEQIDHVETFETVISEPLPRTNRDNTIHRTATFFEKVVSAVYDLIINIMYSIANLFFD